MRNGFYRFKKHFTLQIVLPFTLLVLPLAAQSLSGELGFVSRYVWRGFDVTPNNAPGLQPSLTWTLGSSGFSVNLWSNIPLKDRKLYNDELDLTLSYSRALSDAVSAEVGFIQYGWYFAEDFSFEDFTSQEFYLSLGLSQMPLTPGITFYYNVADSEKGLYIAVQVSHSLPVTAQKSLALSAALGYNNGQWLPEGSDTGFSDLQISASMPFKAGPLAVTASLNYMHPMLDIVNTDDEVWFGITLSK